MNDILTAKPKYGFVRNTHDDKGEYRKDMDEYWNSVPGGITGIYHWLNNKPITVSQLMEIIEKDDVNFDTKPSIDEVCCWVIKEIQYGLIKVVEI